MIHLDHRALKRISIIIMAICSVQISVGKARADSWHKGVIAFADGEVLRGSLKYDHMTGLVQFKRGERHSTYSARKVAEFRYFDQSEKMHHLFRSYHYDNKYGYPIIEFFEVIFMGEVNMLRKHRKQGESKANDTRYAQLSSRWQTHLLPHILDYKYYFLYQGKLCSLQKFRKELLPQIQEDHPLVAEMMDEKQSRKIRQPEELVRFMRRINRKITAQSGGHLASSLKSLP